VDYAKAIELNPAEPVYYQNLATTVYLFRKDARAFYGINEQQVFDKALALYRKAVQLAPDDFPLATDYAQTYYGIRPLRTNDALVAWTNALKIAHDDNEREGVYIHLARIKMSIGRFAEARVHLSDVTNAAFAGLKHRLENSLAERENPPTNSIAAGISTKAQSFPTKAATIASNKIVVPTKPLPIHTNGVPALTNPPGFSAKRVTVLTNVPSAPPNGSNLSQPQKVR
jgi:tetratricopeptide (TPR) repeat protein